MKTARPVALAFVLLAAGCDEKKESAPSPHATASAAPAATTAAPVETAAPVASAAPSASAAAASAGATMITGDAKDAVLTVRDPVKEPEKTMKVAVGGSLTVFLPDYPGTVWSVEGNDRTLGKPKEEVIPGFAPGTNGHQFKWTMNGPLIKAGQKHKVQLVNKKLADKTAKPGGTFALTIDVT